MREIMKKKEKNFNTQLKNKLLVQLYDIYREFEDKNTKLGEYEILEILASTYEDLIAICIHKYVKTEYQNEMLNHFVNGVKNRIKDIGVFFEGKK
jgi:hypothetical protein